MSASNRTKWVSNGSPFRLIRPAQALRDVLRGYGYTVYDIGNRAHLEASPPEDHTPYSATGWPGKAAYGVGYAIDIMPPPAGSGLPSLQQLGAQMLADRKAGVGGIRWLKYMNWEPTRDNGGACYQESWQPNYSRRSSSDRGHIHASGLTGFEDSTIGAGYDPVARIRGKDDDMPDSFTDRVVKDWNGALSALYAWRPQVDQTLKTILDAVRGDLDSEQILARIDQRAAEAQSLADQRASALRTGLVAELLERLPEDGPVTQEMLDEAVEAGLTAVLSRAVGVTPAS